MEQKHQQIYSAWVWPVAIITLLPFFVVCFFALPAADDFCSAVFAHNCNNNFYQFFSYHYSNLTGRYVSIVLFYFSPLVWHTPSFYPLVLLCFIILAFIVTYYTTRTLHNKLNLQLGNLKLSLLLFTALLTGYMHVAETLYWYTAVCMYTLGYILAALLANVLVSDISRKLKFLISALLILLCTGTNEVTITATVAIVAYFILFGHDRDRLWLLVPLALGIIIYSLAPGNGIRLGHYAGNLAFWHSTLYAMGYSIYFIARWLLNPVFIIALCLFMYGGFSMHLSCLIPLRQAIVILCFALSIVFLSCFLPIYSTGILGQHRTIDAAWPVLLFASVIASYSAGAHYHRTIESLKLQLPAMRIYIILVCFLMLVAANSNVNSYHLWQEIFSGNISRFYNQRKSQLNGIKESKDAMLNNVAPTCGSFILKSYDIINGDSTHYVNNCEWNYYHQN